MSIEDLGVQPRRLAVTAIQRTHKDYTKPNGLRDLEARIEQETVKCSKHIFGLARYAFENSEDPIEMFTDLCAYAEEQFKTRHNVENVKDVLPVWAVFKSNINRGLRADLDPRQFDTEWDFRKATMDQVRGNNGNGTADKSTRAPRTPTTIREPEVPEMPVPAVADRVEDWVESTTIHNTLKFLVTRLVIEAEYVKKGKEKEAEKILREAIGALHRLVDRKRITDEATKAALEEAA